MSSTVLKSGISESHEHRGKSRPAIRGPQANNVWRLLPDAQDLPDVAPQFEALTQALAASRSMTLARLVTLRLMSSKNPVRSHLTKATVQSAQDALLVEEEITDAIISEAGLKTSSGTSYVSAHMRLQQLQRAESWVSPRGLELDRWELLISEAIHTIQSCALYVQRAASSVAGCDIDWEKINRQHSALASGVERSSDS